MSSTSPPPHVKQLAKTAQRNIFSMAPEKLAAIGKKLMTLFKNNPEARKVVVEVTEASVDPVKLEALSKKKPSPLVGVILKIIGVPFWLVYKFIGNAASKAAAFVYFALILGSIMSALMAAVFYIYGKNEGKFHGKSVKVVSALYGLSQSKEDTFLDVVQSLVIKPFAGVLDTFKGYSDWLFGVESEVEKQSEEAWEPLDKNITFLKATSRSINLSKKMAMSINVIGLDIFFSTLGYPVYLLGLLLKLKTAGTDAGEILQMPIHAKKEFITLSKQFRNFFNNADTNSTTTADTDTDTDTTTL